MIRFAFAVIVALAPLPAFALSCLPHGVSDAYLAAAQSEAGYVPVIGTLTFDKTLLPKVDWEAQQDVPQETLLPAQFSGEALSVRGIRTPLNADVVLQVQCAGPWCPSAASGPMLGFLRNTTQSYVLSTHACGGFLFTNPTTEQIQELTDCMAGRTCTRWQDR
ncbi:hypothetical protein [uncultured Tateyamaria sp.]|uniref:hypothetical protein n=1 Tax=uncultured Tateyamaria sp. TaxID=455651 RepID=UPI0026216BFD|nr:hypothetical protein [uncultured Tateyamaria sp.]